MKGVIAVLRVISGSARGRRLKTLPGRKTRPTTDRVKESVFNIIAPYVSGARVLDLFSGTGSLAVEALSRGAAYAVLVERDRTAMKIILENLKNTGLEEMARVLRMDVFSALNKLSQSDEKFDIILIDPPYGAGIAEKTVKLVWDSGVAGKEGIIVVESEKNREGKEDRKPIQPVREEIYGRTIISFYKG